MTDRKAAHRKRKRAGWEHVSGYAKSADAREIRARLLRAKDIDAAIEATQ